MGDTLGDAHYIRYAGHGESYRHSHSHTNLRPVYHLRSSLGLESGPELHDHLLHNSDAVVGDADDD